MSRIFKWLRDAYHLWIAIFAIPIVLLICGVFFSAWEPRVRLSGMLLELMGLATVAIGLRKTRSLFGRQSLFAAGRGWLQRFPRFRNDVTAVGGVASISLGGVTGAGFGTVGPGPTATLEERVILLEKKIDQAHLLIHETQRKLDQESQVRQNALTSEQHARVVGDDKNKQLIEEVAAGGLYLETIGVCWLAFGITLATATNELIQFVKLLLGN